MGHPCGNPLPLAFLAVTQCPSSGSPTTQSHCWVQSQQTLLAGREWSLDYQRGQARSIAAPARWQSVKQNWPSESPSTRSPSPKRSPSVWIPTRPIIPTPKNHRNTAEHHRKRDRKQALSKSTQVLMSQKSRAVLLCGSIQWVQAFLPKRTIGSPVVACFFLAPERKRS